VAIVPVVLVPYDPDWPRRFETERALLARVFADAPASIDHVGSTAVPGLAAKPVIDIMVGVSALSEIESRIPELERHGYEYVPEYEAQLPERRYLRKPRVGPRTHHLHAVVRDSTFWRRHLLFRDYLRGHPETAAAYLELKQRLASLHRSDRAAYSEGKSSFVEAVLARAAAPESA
jgi:GrpB-like predicted nucleotidyltransferase (UPF0157 family)